MTTVSHAATCALNFSPKTNSTTSTFRTASIAANPLDLGCREPKIGARPAAHHVRPICLPKGPGSALRADPIHHHLPGVSNHDTYIDIDIDNHNHNHPLPRTRSAIERNTTSAIYRTRTPTIPPLAINTYYPPNPQPRPQLQATRGTHLRQPAASHQVPTGQAPAPHGAELALHQRAPARKTLPPHRGRPRAAAVLDAQCAAWGCDSAQPCDGAGFAGFHAQGDAVC